MVPLSAIAHYENQRTSLAVNHQGQYPAVTLTFNLAPNVALGDAVTALEKVQREMGMPSDDSRQLPGNRAGLSGLAQERALPDSGRAGGRLHRAWHSV